jgi:hypothetical protein
MMHIVCYMRHGSAVFETYWTTGRGVEAMDNSYRMLDLTVYGRQEAWEGSPPAWPQQCTYTRTSSGPPTWRPVWPGGRPIAQWPRLEAGHSRRTRKQWGLKPPPPFLRLPSSADNVSRYKAHALLSCSTPISALILSGGAAAPVSSDCCEGHRISGCGPPLPTCALHKVGRLARVLRTCRSYYRHGLSWPDPDSASIIGGSLSITDLLRSFAYEPVAPPTIQQTQAYARLFPSTGNSTFVEMAADPVFGTPRTAPPGGASVASVDGEAHDNDKIGQQLLNVERDAYG